METIVEFAEKKPEELIKKEMEKFKQKIQGKVVCLYGQAWVGKSLFALNLSKYFKNAKLFLVDKNYPAEFFKVNPNLQVIEIDSPRQLDLMISKTPSLDDQLIIIDSITTLQTEFIRESYFSPRAYVEFNNFSDKVARQLTALTPRTTSLVIAHERIKDWEKKTVVPRLNWVFLRNIGIIAHMVQEDDKRKIVIERVRELPSKVEFYFE